jgi:hypothetical protein
VMGLFAAFLGTSPFRPLEVIAHSVLDVDGEAQPWGWALLGALVHQLGPSLFWGTVFGITVWALRPQRGAALLMLGLIVGAVAEVVDVNLIIPLFSHGSVATFSGATIRLGNAWVAHVPVIVSWVGHLAFGAALSLYPWTYDPLAKTFD